MAATPKITVAWCPDCMMQTEGNEDIGNHCWNDCDRILVKRVGYLCREPSPGHPAWYLGTLLSTCQMFHRTVTAMKACKHDAY